MTYIKVNLNQRMRFKLTERAKRDPHFAGIGLQEEDDWRSCELWYFCREFGPGFRIGNPIPPVFMDIEIETTQS